MATLTAPESDERQSTEVDDLERDFAAPSYTGKDAGDNTPAPVPSAPIQNKPKAKVQGFGQQLRKHWMGAVMGALGSVLIVLFIFLFLFLLGFKLNHIKNLFESYQFASFGQAMSERLDHIVTDEIITSEGSDALPEGSESSLYEKIRGWDANEGLRALGKDGLKFDFEDGGLLRKGRLRGFTDTTTGESFYIEGSTAPTGAKILEKDAFKSTLGDTVDKFTFNESNYFRRKTSLEVYDRAGIKLNFFEKWKERFKDRAASSDDAKNELKTEETDTMREGSSTVAQDEIDKARKSNGLTDEQAAHLKTSEAIGEVSSWVFYATVYCIIKDVGDSVFKALDLRQDNFMREAAQTNTIADMQKRGKAPTDGLNAANNQWDGFETAAATQRASGEHVTGPDLPKDDYPQTVFGLSVSDVQTFKSVFEAATNPECVLDPTGACEKLSNYIIGKGCSVILNPVAQGVVALGEVIAAVSSLGGSEGLSELGTKLIEPGVKLVAGIGLSEYIFGHLLPSFIEELSGTKGSSAVGPAKANRYDAGENLLANSTAINSGAHAISNDRAVANLRLALEARDRRDAAKGPMYAFFNLDNPHSVAAQSLAAIPTTPRGMVAMMQTIWATMRSPQRFIDLFTQSALAEPELSANAFYGMQQYGWDPGEINGSNTKFDFVTNSSYIEGKIRNDDYKSKYSKCFDKITNRLSLPDCDSEEARRYTMYVGDCFNVELLVNANTDKDIYHQSECSDLAGFKNSTVTP